MTSHRLLVTWLLGFLVEGACGGTMSTGTVAQRASDKPDPNGTCPSGQSVCGTGVFAVCTDIQSDPNHCGSCAMACSPGIVCQTGACQQAVCGSSTMPFSSQGSISTGPSCSELGPPDSVAPIWPIYNPYYSWLNQSQALADVNGDGLLDFIFWYGFPYSNSCGSSEFQVSLGQAGGGLGPRTAYHAIDVISRVFVSDANGDGLADLYVASFTPTSSLTSTGSTINHCHVQLWLGQKDGQLQLDDAAGTKSVDSSGCGQEMAMGDVSGDGWPDLVMGAPGGDTSLPSSEMSVYLSDATGALHWSQTFDGWGPTVIADMNGDGSPDLMMLNDGMDLLYNGGNGTFGSLVDCGISFWGGALLTADFNRDGWTDLAFAGAFAPADSGVQVNVMLGSGGCGFSPITSYDMPGASEWFLRAADMTGDGILDIVSVSAVFSPATPGPTGLPTSNPTIADNLLAVLLGNGDGTFHLATPAISLGPDQVFDVTVGAVGGDQRPDIVIQTVNGQSTQVNSWENTCQ